MTRGNEYLLDAADLDGGDGNRTHDLLLARQMLSQLSYTPKSSGCSGLLAASKERETLPTNVGP